MYIFGGINSFNALSDLWKFSIESSSWEHLRRKGNSPSARQGHGCCISAVKMYIFGGENSLGEKLNDLWSFDMRSHQLSKIAINDVLPTPSVYSCLVSLHPDPSFGSSRVEQFRNSPEYLTYTDLENGNGQCALCNDKFECESHRQIVENYERLQSAPARPQSNTIISSNLRPQKSADSGYVEEMGNSQDQLLQRVGRPTSIGSDSYMVNPAFDAESINELGSIASQLSTLPGAIDEWSPSQLQHTPKPKPRRSLIPSSEAIELKTFTPSSRAKLNAWMDEPLQPLTQIITPPDSPEPQQLCTHGDGKCTQLMLMGGRTGDLVFVKGFQPIDTWVCCIRQKS